MPRLTKEKVATIDNDIINSGLSIDELSKKYNKNNKYINQRKYSLQKRGLLSSKTSSNTPKDIRLVQLINNSITINGISIESANREVWVSQENNRLHLKW